MRRRHLVLADLTAGETNDDIEIERNYQALEFVGGATGRPRPASRVHAPSCRLDSWLASCTSYAHLNELETMRTVCLHYARRGRAFCISLNAEESFLRGFGHDSKTISALHAYLFIKTDTMPPLFAITGNILKRFIQAATLLSCLDPVRGEPTTYSLDRHPDDAQDDAGDRQMKKFLDSIALICATRKDGDTVSAATLEEWSPDGSIIRIARNSGLPEETLEQIREIVELLNDIAQKGTS